MNEEMLYVPGHGLFLADEARKVMYEADDPDLEPLPAEFVLNRDGARGHYLAPCFLQDAADLLEDSDEEIDKALIAQFREVADVYGDGSEPEWASGGDLLNIAENALWQLGYQVEWDDGFVIYRIHPKGDA